MIVINSEMVQKNKQVKFCGFTRRIDVEMAISLGVDAIGLVFYPPSTRYVTPQRALEITQGISAFTSIVALVVNTTAAEIRLLSETLPFDIIQFHGDETPEKCGVLAKVANKRWIKALRINSQEDTVDTVTCKVKSFQQAGASGIILDAYHKDFYGGTGERFDWSIIPENCGVPIILAGGLTPENVNMVKNLPVDGVDVSGGIELEKGIKDGIKMRNFLLAIK